MNLFYFDTSALIKRYHEEKGTDNINFLMNAIAEGIIKAVISTLAISESISTINRKKNQGFIDTKIFAGIISAFCEDMNYFEMLQVNDQKIISSVAYIIKYNLNSADALQLVCAVESKTNFKLKNRYFFVCCDKRLLAAAKKEKLNTINLESISKVALKRLLTG